jgi:hypothetical protein
MSVRVYSVWVDGGSERRGDGRRSLTSRVHARSERYSPATRAAVIPPPDNAQDTVLGWGDVGGGCRGE